MMQPVIPFMGSAVIPDFQYYAPNNLNGLIKILKKSKHDSSTLKILAGGMSLVPMMRLGLVRPKIVIDLNNVEQLKRIVLTQSGVRIGSMVRYAELASSNIIKKYFPMIIECISQIGDMQVRNRGTIGGAIAHADPASDICACLLALDAYLVILNERGRRRRVKLDGFFKGPFTTILKPTEVIAEVILPVRRGMRCVGKYIKVERAAGDFAIAGVAVAVWIDESNTIVHAGVGLTNAGLKPLKVTKAERALVNNMLTDDVIDRVVNITTDVAEPLSDIRGDVQYKKHLVAVLTRRCLLLIREETKIGEKL
jgi:carbon-monoxide dehydrogenase medium subunit